MAQHRVLREQREHLAGHEGAKAHDLARADLRPFGVRAGQADDAVEVGLRGQKPGDLGFLAAHHVGGARPGSGRAGYGRESRRSCVGTCRLRDARRRGRERSHRAPRPSPAARRPCRSRSRSGGRVGRSPTEIEQRRFEPVAARACPCPGRLSLRPSTAPFAAHPPQRADARCPSRPRSSRYGQPQRSSRHHHAAIDDHRLPGHHLRLASEARNSTPPTMSSGARCSFRHWRSRWAASPSGVAHRSCLLLGQHPAGRQRVDADACRARIRAPARGSAR